MNSQYTLLIEKLDEFIRKHYKNLLIKGGIYFVSGALLFLLVFAAMEYFGHFSIAVRTFLFYSYILINTFISVKYVIFPLLGLYKIGKTISHKQAADIIGTYFSNIKDKLYNTLQLQELSGKETYASKELIEASINQRISELKPIPFTNAVNFGDNKKYLKFIALPIAILIAISIFYPSILTKGTTRLIEHRRYFKKEAPFSFRVLNKKLDAVQNEDITIQVKVDGSEIPDEVFLKIGESNFKMEKENKITFNYIIKNVQKDQEFVFVANEFQSDNYTIKVIPNPIILRFQTLLKYPAYLHKKDEIVNNSGDLMIPEGTEVSWTFFTKNTSTLKVSFNDLVSYFVPRENKVQINKRIKNNTTYSVTSQNNLIKNKDSVNYLINIIPDNFPEIAIQEFKDSLNFNQKYFTGQINDDYGLTKLNFNYKVVSSDDKKETSLITKSIQINKNITDQQFFYYLNLSDLNLKPGDEVTYYFEVWDNDGVNGAKSTKSKSQFYKLASEKELSEKIEKQSAGVKSDIDKSLKLAMKLQKDLTSLQKSLSQKKEASWEDKKKLEDVMKAQEELKKDVEKINEENKQKNKTQSDLDKPSQELLDKQQKLQEMFENVMTDEMKKMLEEIKKMMEEKLDKDKMQEAIDKMKLSNEDISKELDRNLELFKQLEFEQKLKNTIDQLKDVQEKQDKLSDESKESKEDQNKLQDEQKKLNEEFKDVKKDLDELEKKNESLEEPQKMEKTDPLQKDIDQEQKNASDQLQKKKNNKASESQKKASEGMKQLSDKLEKMQQEIEQETNEEDAKSLREILENLLKMSFEQEEIIKVTQKINVRDPKYIQLVQRQKKLRDDSKMIEDSLFALSKRVVEIQPIVNREINLINFNVDKSQEMLVERNTSSAAYRQQTAMTSINNLALMLSEALKQMQQKSNMKMQMKSSGKSKKQCKNPQQQAQGQGKRSLKSMKQMQDQLNKQMQELKNKMGNDKKMGLNMSGMSEKLAKLAAQQEAMRNELQKMANELKNSPNGDAKKLEKIANEMEQTETDLVNKNITNETLRRQQEILTRLLDAEKSERERDEEQKRESKESKVENFGNFFEKNKYNIIKKQEIELLMRVPPAFNEFYKKKINEFFNKADGDVRK